MDDKEWFVGRNGKQAGPFSFAVIQAAASKDKLKADDLVWRHGMPDWRRADSLPELVEFFPKPAAIPPVSPPPPAAKPEAVRPSTGNYLLKNWRGEYSLPVSYWVNSVLIGVLCVLAVKTLAQMGYPSSLSMRVSGSYTLALIATLILISVWSGVGVWRSSGHHVERGGTAAWAVVAKVMVILGVIRLLLALAGQVPVIAQSLALARGNDIMTASRLRVVNHATEVEIAGGLSFGTEDSLKTILDATPTIKLVQLNNIGGWMREGEQLAQLVRERHLATYTARECDSACLLVFLAGSNRLIGEKGKLGFHQASVAGLSGPGAESGNQTFRTALTQSGAPPDFIEHALSTPPSSMWYPTHQELKDAHLITAVVDDTHFGQTDVAGWRDRDEIIRGLRSTPLFAAWEQADPATFEAFKNSYVGDIQAGVPQQEAIAHLRAFLVNKTLPTYLRHGQNRPLVAYWKVQVEEMEQMRDSNPARCISYLFPAKSQSLPSTITKRTEQADLSALSALLSAGKEDPSINWTQQAVSPALRKAGAQTEQEMPGALHLVSTASGATATPKQTCQAFIVFYNNIASLPEDEAGAVFKYIASRS